MLKREKIILWPIYFDSNKTHSMGRRVPRKLAVTYPKVEEIKIAAEELGIHSEISHGAMHPSVSWQKDGYITLPKNNKKTKIIRKIAEKISEKRKKH